jgi:hypothetical protein
MALATTGVACKIRHAHQVSSKYDKGLALIALKHEETFYVKSIKTKKHLADELDSNKRLLYITARTGKTPHKI